MLLSRLPPLSLTRLQTPQILLLRRHLQTLEKDKHVYIFPQPNAPRGHLILTLLSADPPNPHLCLGTTTRIPPVPESFTENRDFMQLLQAVVAEYATKDPDVIAQARAFASNGGAGLGSGGVFFQGQSKMGRNRRRAGGGGGGAGQGGAGGASAQGGTGGGGVGGFVHVADQRNPPDWGRIAWPEDIMGSLEVDGEGRFVEPNGRYQRSGTYRICTNDGVLGISPFLREKLVQSLKEIEKSM